MDNTLQLVLLILFIISAIFTGFYVYLRYLFTKHNKQADVISQTLQINSELLRLEKNQEDFVNMASHELKLPVTVLKAYIQMIGLKKGKPDFADNFVSITEKMDTQLDKLLNIIEDLQDATSVKSDSLTCLMSKFNLNESIRNCTEGALIAHPNATIEHELVQPDPIIEGDKDRIEQVIENFIGNGIKYSGSEKHLKICTIMQDDYVKVTISDHGFGIPAEKQPYVFERFYRAGTPQVKNLPGLGLGLFICKEIINKHHGKIGLDSEEGKGSEFWFCLPIS